MRGSFYDLDPRSVKRRRVVTVVEQRGDFALCVSNTGKRPVRIHVSRLTNPRLFRPVAA